LFILCNKIKLLAHRFTRYSLPMDNTKYFTKPVKFINLSYFSCWFRPVQSPPLICWVELFLFY